MPLLDIQRRLREIGRIRIGQQVPFTRKDGSEGTRPAKLRTFRLTSPSQDLILAAAELYGGEPQPWEGAPGDQAQWEVVTQADQLKALVPPQSTMSQWYELWSGGGCQRRCDGETEHLGERPCLCPEDLEERRKAASQGEACKPTTRLSLMLPDLPDIGVWRIESHGFYAATELAGSQEICSLATARGHMIPVTLRLEQRERKVPGGPTIKFAVPVLELEAKFREVLEALELGGRGPLILGPARALRELPAAHSDERLRQLPGGSLEQGLAKVSDGNGLKQPEPKGKQRRSAAMPGGPGSDVEAAFASEPPVDLGARAPLPTGGEDLPEVPMATQPQQGMLHGLSKKLGWTEEQAHETAGVEHYRELTKDEAHTLIDAWQAELEAVPVEAEASPAADDGATAEREGQADKAVAPAPRSASTEFVRYTNAVNALAKAMKEPLSSIRSMHVRPYAETHGLDFPPSRGWPVEHLDALAEKLERQLGAMDGAGIGSVAPGGK